MTLSAVPDLSARAAAARCGVDERTVRRWIASGRLQADKRGGTFLIALAALAPFLPPVSGHPTGHAAAPDMAAAPNTNGATPCPPMSAAPAAAPDTEAPHLGVALQHAQDQLVTLARDLAATSAAAAMWQGRAEVLRDELDTARSALKALGPGPPVARPPWWERWCWWRRP